MRRCAPPHLFALPEPARPPLRRIESGWLGGRASERIHVCLGSHPRTLPRFTVARVCEAAYARGVRGGLARHRFWSHGRGLRPIQFDREQSSHSTGGEKHTILPATSTSVDGCSCC